MVYESPPFPTSLIHMPIYTKTGDKGETSLFGGKRVKKFDEQVEAYGNVDELTSFIGLVIVNNKQQTVNSFLIEVQKNLYQIMAKLAGAPEKIEHLTLNVERLEKEIDQIEKELPELHSFIIPGGTELSALFHVARTVCRRAERSLVQLFFHNGILEEANNAVMIRYLNRLSDLFFILARQYNQENEIKLTKNL